MGAAAAGTGAQASTDAQGSQSGTETQGTGKTGDQAQGTGKTGEQQGEQQAGKGGDTGAGGKAGAGDGKPKAPERYEFTIPDDRKASTPKKLLERVEAIARANDWTQDEANAELADLYKFDTEIRTETVKGFETELKGDTDFGGDNLAETQRLANLAIDKVFPEGHRLRERFVNTLKASGYGSELSIAGFLATVGKLAAEDTHVRGRTGPRKPAETGTNDEAADKLYDHPTSQRAQDEGTGKRAAS